MLSIQDGGESADFTSTSLQPFLCICIIDPPSDLKPTFKNSFDSRGVIGMRSRDEPGQEASTSFAAASFPEPSLMTCPPVSPFAW